MEGPQFETVELEVFNKDELLAAEQGLLGSLEDGDALVAAEVYKLISELALEVPAETNE